VIFNQAPRHEGVLGEWRYSSTHSLTSVLDGGEWSASRPSRFIPEKSPWYTLPNIITTIPKLLPC